MWILIVLFFFFVASIWFTRSQCIQRCWMQSLLYTGVTDVLSDNFISVAVPCLWHKLWLRFAIEQHHLNLKPFCHHKRLSLEEGLLDCWVVGWSRQRIKKNFRALPHQDLGAFVIQITGKIISTASRKAFRITAYVVSVVLCFYDYRYLG